MFEKRLGQRGIYSGLMSGIGYVFIPNDIQDRDKFISNCYNTCSISFITTEGQRFDDVPVSKTIFYDFNISLNTYWLK